MRVDDRPSSAPRRRAGRLAAWALLPMLCVGLGRDRPAFSAPLQHEAYVWQHRWGPAMASAVAARPRELAALRVLGLHLDAGATQPGATEVDLRALVGAGPVTLVQRIDGARLPPTATLAPLRAMAARWRAAGVEVRDLEVDHDCATAALPAYAAWLRRERARLATAAAADLPLAITALPTWLDAPEQVRALAAAVDRVTLQVHTIAAPTIFDADAALRAARAWADASDRPFWIALPTYRARLRGGAAAGAMVGVEPADVARTLTALQRAPIEGLRGAVWFRLAFDGDGDAWPATTLAALMRHEPVHAEAVISLRPAGPQLWDIVVAGRGNAPARVPSLLRLQGVVTDLHGANGCRGGPQGLRCPDDLRVNVGQERVLGYVRGQEVRHGG